MPKGRAVVHERNGRQAGGALPGSRRWRDGGPISHPHVPDRKRIEIGATLDGTFDYIHLFATSRLELEARLPDVKAHLEPAGALWLSWPKGGGLGTDLSLPEVIRIGYGHGLVESTCLSVNATWSALRFTFPKRGKTYANRYGALPAR